MPSRPNRRAGHSVLAVAALALAVALAPAPSAAVARPATTLPGQGLYEGCSPGSEANACIEHLVAIRAAGFRYVLDYSAWYGSAADVLRYADAAAALGLKLIWPLNNPAWRGIGSLAATYSIPSTPSPATSLSRAVGLVAGLPATWGFYVGDELPSSEAGRLRRLSVTVRRLAPAKPQLYVARPGIAQLEPFAPFADVLGADPYPVGSGDPSVARAARDARAVASAAGAQTAMVLQAFSWSQYLSSASPCYPSEPELRAMRDAALRVHPSMILWYSYQDILRSDHPRHRWQELVRATLAPPRRSVK